MTPIPKIPQPKVIDDLRNISGLMNLNKILEKVTCKMVVSDMRKNMDPAQFGNKKGVSIQHYLIKLLDRVIRALDNNSRGEAVAVIATMIDWRQAYQGNAPPLPSKASSRMVSAPPSSLSLCPSLRTGECQSSGRM